MRDDTFLLMSAGDAHAVNVELPVAGFAPQSAASGRLSLPTHACTAFHSNGAFLGGTFCRQARSGRALVTAAYLPAIYLLFRSSSQCRFSSAFYAAVK